MSVISAIPVHWVVLEPPKQLYKLGRVHSLFRTLKSIAKRNGKDIEMYQLQRQFDFEDFDLSEEKLKFVIKTSFKEKLELILENLRIIFCSKMVIKVICYSIMAGSVYITFFGVTYNASKVGLPSLQLNVMLLAGVECICYLMSIAIVAKAPRKFGSFICLGLIIIGTIFLVIAHALWSSNSWNKY